MSATATMKWSGRRASQTRTGNWSAAISYDVIDATTEQDAIAALGVAEGDAHPDPEFASCKADTFDPVQIGPRHWNVTVNYVSDFIGDAAALDKPARIQWSIETQTEDIDRDADGNAIMNSAYDAITNGLPMEFPDIRLVYTRWEDAYDPVTAAIRAATVNENAILVAATFTAPAGMVKLVGYAPTSEYSEGQSPVEIRYEFIFRNLLVDSDISGWDFRIKDVGTRGKFTVGGVQQWGNFYNSKRELLTEPVLLDGSGVPLDISIKCGKDLTAADTLDSPPGAVFDSRFMPSGSTPGCMFLVYKRNPRFAMETLIPLFTAG